MNEVSPPLAPTVEQVPSIHTKGPGEGAPLVLFNKAVERARKGKDGEEVTEEQRIPF